MCGGGRLLSLRDVGDLDERLVEYVAEDEVLFVEVEGAGGGGRGDGAVALAPGVWFVSSAASRPGEIQMIFLFYSESFQNVVALGFLAEGICGTEGWIDLGRYVRTHEVRVELCLWVSGRGVAHDVR